METKRFAYYRKGNRWVGWLEEYPDYWTLGESMDELQDNLRAICDAVAEGSIPYVFRADGDLAPGDLRPLGGTSSPGDIPIGPWAGYSPITKQR